MAVVDHDSLQAFEDGDGHPRLIRHWSGISQHLSSYHHALARHVNRQKAANHVATTSCEIRSRASTADYEMQKGPT